MTSRPPTRGRKRRPGKWKLARQAQSVAAPIEEKPFRAQQLLLAAVLLAGLLVQVAALFAERIHWNSDQAISGLMGRHILTGREHPIFYYGSHYAGTLEAHYLALVFLLFGTSYSAYRIGMMLLLLIHSIVVYALGRRVFGERAALAAVAFLALPPYFFLYKGLTSDGAYTSFLVLGSGMLYAAVRLEEAAGQRRREASTAWVAVLGGLAGLTWWLLPLGAYFYLAILVWFLAVRRSVLADWRHYAAFAAAFLFGSLPWWIANVGKGWPSLTIPPMGRARASAFPNGLLQFFTRGVPALFGARSTPFLGDVFPGASVVALLVFAVPVLAAVLALRRPAAGKEANPRARRVLLLLLLTIASMVCLAAFNEDTYKRDVRYLIAIYSPFALLAGHAVARARLPRAALAAIAVGVLLFHGVSIGRAPRIPIGEALPSGAAVDRIIQALRERGIQEAYASYWIAYALALQSREEIAVASFGLGTAGAARYTGYLSRVAASPNPAFVLFGREAERFGQYLRLRGSEGETFDVATYRVFWKVSPAVLAEAAALRYVPTEVVPP